MVKDPAVNILMKGGGALSEQTINMSNDKLMQECE